MSEDNLQDFDNISTRLTMDMGTIYSRDNWVYPKFSKLYTEEIIKAYNKLLGDKQNIGEILKVQRLTKEIVIHYPTYELLKRATKFVNQLLPKNKVKIELRMHMLDTACAQQCCDADNVLFMKENYDKAFDEFLWSRPTVYTAFSDWLPIVYDEVSKAYKAYKNGEFLSDNRSEIDLVLADGTGVYAESNNTKEYKVNTEYLDKEGGIFIIVKQNGKYAVKYLTMFKGTYADELRDEDFKPTIEDAVGEYMPIPRVPIKK